MYCTHCGTQVRDARFCSSCGASQAPSGRFPRVVSVILVRVVRLLRALKPVLLRGAETLWAAALRLASRLPAAAMNMESRVKAAVAHLRTEIQKDSPPVPAHCSQCGRNVEPQQRFCSACGAAQAFAHSATAERRLYRPREGRVAAGVCAGFADYLALDVALVRVVWLALIVFSAGGMLLAYAACWILMPEGDGAPAAEPSGQRAGVPSV